MNRCLHLLLHKPIFQPEPLRLSFELSLPHRELNLVSVHRSKSVAPSWLFFPTWFFLTNDLFTKRLCIELLLSLVLFFFFYIFRRAWSWTSVKLSVSSLPAFLNFLTLQGNFTCLLIYLWIFIFIQLRTIAVHCECFRVAFEWVAI